jgi:glycosyltransferase involved in cell wall biosynthesis
MTSHQAPRLSVVIPVFNRASVLPRAVGSVLRQTMDDLEVVVVDDGSQDETAAVARSHGDSRVRLVRLTTNQGVARARNVGVREARGDWIAFLDSDDEWRPPRLERQRDWRAAGDSSVMYCRYVRHVPDPVSRWVPGPALHCGDAFRALVRGWDPLPSCVVARRAVLAAMRPFDESLPAFADYEMWLRLAAGGVDFVGLDEVLVVKHEEGRERLSSDPVRLGRGFERLDAAWGRRIGDRLGVAERRRWRARLLASIAYVEVRGAMARGDRGTAWKHCLRLLRLGPWAGRYAILGVGMAVLGLRAYATLARAQDAVARRAATGSSAAS